MHPGDDIFALGLILNEMFTGGVPQGTGYAAIGSRIAELGYLDDLVALMIQHDVRNRPQSIALLKRELAGRRNDFIQRQELDRTHRGEGEDGADRERSPGRRRGFHQAKHIPLRCPPSR